uniref:Uncharacterized protein n=1 Tax=Anguilla anguilla TaxID=7936 RepID=A0A0E9WXU8_ANGAN
MCIAGRGMLRLGIYPGFQLTHTEFHCLFHTNGYPQNFPRVHLDLGITVLSEPAPLPSPPFPASFCLSSSFPGSSVGERRYLCLWTCSPFDLYVL